MFTHKYTFSRQNTKLYLKYLLFAYIIRLTNKERREKSTMSRHFMFQLRMDKGMSQQELAERCGVSNKTISNIETGRRSPSGKLALKLATVLGCNMSLFFEKEEKSA